VGATGELAGLAHRDEPDTQLVGHRCAEDEPPGLDADDKVDGPTAPVAYHFGAGFVPVRKAGKLPLAAHSESYTLGYGSATLELPEGAIAPGERVVIVDDVLATGGTARATAKLVERAEGRVIGIACPLELGFLEGRKQIAEYEFFSLINY
jgi:adenine phosphoribosyltransferase